MASRVREALTGLLAATALLSLVGCGAAARSSSEGTSGASAPSDATEPFTHEQQLVEQGGRLIVTDGCSACHLAAAGRRLAPGFASFAGHRVTLIDGRQVLVDEHFLRESLVHPGRYRIKGYDPAPMLAAITRLHLAQHPQAVAALSAFIEQVGPEP